MIFVLTSLALSLMALPLLREAISVEGRIKPYGFDGIGVVILFMIVSSISVVTSPGFGIAFIFAALLHELLSARACNILGHDLTRIRLVPVPLLAPRRSDKTINVDLEESFVALFAPAISILPMLFALGIFHTTIETAPLIAHVSRNLAVMIGAFNFVLLLPFSPFPGGKIVVALTSTLWPGFGKTLTIFMSAAFFSAAYKDHSLAFALLGVAGLQSLLHKACPKEQSLSPNHALLVMASYAFTLTVHFLGGFWLLQTLI